MLFQVIFVTVILILSYVYFKGIKNQYYWKKRGVAFYEKYESSGPLWQYVIGNKALFEIFSEIYKDSKSNAAIGIGSFFDKALYVTDPVNIRHITQTDFNSFSNRGVPVNSHDILANNVLFINGPKWKLLRQKFTPLLSSAKLKNMYHIIDKSAQDFVAFLKQNPDKLKGDALQIYDTITHFSAASLSASIFGIGTDLSFDSPLRQMVTQIFAPSTAFVLKVILGEISKDIYKACNFKLFGDHEKFFVGVIKNIIRQREQEKNGGVKRHDFADVCLQLKKEGTMIDADTGVTVEPTDEVLSAQAFFFLLAGVDPSAATMFAIIMELGRHPDILERVHKEVDLVFKKYNNHLMYEAISEVKYLDQVLSECLRLYPPFGFSLRQCARDSVLPVGNVPVQKGVKTYVPIFDLHHDPNYYTDPEVFNPERFSKAEQINEMTYLPFGKGNRVCMGGRYARLQILSGLMHFLKHYTLKTHVGKGGIKYLKDPIRVRPINANIEFIPRFK